MRRLFAAGVVALCAIGAATSSAAPTAAPADAVVFPAGFSSPIYVGDTKVWPTVSTPPTTSVPPTTTVPPTNPPTSTTSPATTTTSAPPTTTTTPPAPAGAFQETFSGDLSGWVFAQGSQAPQAAQTPATASIANGALKIVNGQQNYGDATLRSKTKYDLTGGGAVSVDVTDDGNGQTLIGYAYLRFSANPQDAVLSMADEIPAPYYGPVPSEGVDLQLRDNCRIPWGPPVVITYPQVAVQRGNCAALPDGKLRLVYTPGHLSIRNGAGAEIVAYNVTLPPVGYLSLGVHNHASAKYGAERNNWPGQPAVTGVFDNVSYPTSAGTPAPPTSMPTTTTSMPMPSTTVPPVTQPAGSSFAEDFSSAAALTRFDFQLHTSDNGGVNTHVASEFTGEHSMDCGDPTTHRTVHGGQGASTYVDVSGSELIWYCAPGNDAAKGHMMTALDTTDIATLSFSPKQTFTNVTKVCWDQNMNNLGEAKWINVFVVPAADVARDGDMNYAAALGLPFGGVNKQVPSNGFQFTWLRGSTAAYKGYDQTMYFWKSYAPGGMVPDDYAGAGGVSAPRFKICLDNGNLVIARPDGTTDTQPLGTTFPTGPVRVIFQDASYNPVKHNGFSDHLTWHWDNIAVTATG